MRGGQHPSYSDPNRIRVAELEQNHWAEIQASGIAADVAALNIASFGPGTDRHWEDERAELVRHARLQIQTGSFTAKGLPAGLHLVGRMFDDRTVLNAAHAYEHATAWHKARPPGC